MEAKTAADWQKVVQQASRRFSKAFEQEATCYAAFVKEYSGGVDKPLLVMIDNFVKTLASVRDIPADFYRDLARVNLPHAGLYIVGLVMATASAPDNFVKGGKARVFTGEDLSSVKDALIIFFFVS